MHGTHSERGGASTAALERHPRVHACTVQTVRGGGASTAALERHPRVHACTVQTVKGRVPVKCCSTRKASSSKIPELPLIKNEHRALAAPGMYDKNLGLWAESMVQNEHHALREVSQTHGPCWVYTASEQAAWRCELPTKMDLQYCNIINSHLLGVFEHQN
jgi:hypothetical protein